jgi:uroporphyrinogen decarboxylase
MPRTYANDLVLRAARGETTPRTPIWLMRQAGRTDPEYNKLKAEAGMPLDELFKDPDLAARISLLPKRIGVDAIIYFQDILTPLGPMGAPFLFRPGPRLSQPLGDIDAIRRLHGYDMAEELPFIEAIFANIHRELRGELPVLGFAGAPMTLVAFLLENGSFGNDMPNTMSFLREQPAELRHLLAKLTAMTIDYLLYQIESGAAAVQLFESAAFLLPPAIYRDYALPYQQQIFDALKGQAPTIVFARDWADVADLAAAGADVISLPASISAGEARERLERNVPVQGNLDNQLLASGSRDAIAEAVIACLESGGRRGHIFNLSHGLLKETPFANVEYVVDLVRRDGQAA